MLYAYIIQKMIYWSFPIFSNLCQCCWHLRPRSYCTNPQKNPTPNSLTPWLWMRMMISAQWGHSSLDSKDSGRELVLNFWRKRSHWGWGVVGREGLGVSGKGCEDLICGSGNRTEFYWNLQMPKSFRTSQFFKTKIMPKPVGFLPSHFFPKSVIIFWVMLCVWSKDALTVSVLCWMPVRRCKSAAEKLAIHSWNFKRYEAWLLGGSRHSQMSTQANWKIGKRWKKSTSAKSYKDELKYKSSGWNTCPQKSKKKHRTRQKRFFRHMKPAKSHR